MVWHRNGVKHVHWLPWSQESLGYWCPGFIASRGQLSTDLMEHPGPPLDVSTFSTWLRVWSASAPWCLLAISQPTLGHSKSVVWVTHSHTNVTLSTQLLYGALRTCVHTAVRNWYCYGHYCHDIIRYMQDHWKDKFCWSKLGFSWCRSLLQLLLN